MCRRREWCAECGSPWLDDDELTEAWAECFVLTDNVSLRESLDLSRELELVVMTGPRLLCRRALSLSLVELVDADGECLEVMTPVA